ncbi:DUF922 domain-containing protein [Flavivirga algicola]|uniref:DUF922 domain-containing Zn-dependent protease n=1 Tax=Flavivirga algicola TaxID=2729136 RepID=A0ABX1S2T7_9FLAO|nr:DUF922 domain-containing protein [Flavivirga algicola]NMH89383.1 DUF922 domain-containing Zn-dependent protease [Flavivirga algicola]
MIKAFLVLSCFLCVQQDEPAMSWNASYKLSWSDFKDTPDKSTSAVAITASGITFGFSVRTSDNCVVSFTSEVYAHFYPEKSWYKKEQADIHVLGHEQLHFDITELHARKFRQRISQVKVSNSVRNELKTLHNIINKELSQMQSRYDSETNYSRNVEAQAKWDIYIANELKKLSKYKSVD